MALLYVLIAFITAIYRVADERAALFCSVGEPWRDSAMGSKKNWVP
jgi:hypothetical protein